MDDASLRLLLADDALPERDPAFTGAVMQRIARRRLVAELFDLAPLALAAAGLLWAVAPQAEPLVGALRGADFEATLIASVIAASVLLPTGFLRAARA